MFRTVRPEESKQQRQKLHVRSCNSIFILSLLALSLACWQPTRNFHKKQNFLLHSSSRWWIFQSWEGIKMWLRVEKQNFRSHSRLHLTLHAPCDVMMRRHITKAHTQASVSALRLTMLWQQLYCHSSAEHFERLCELLFPSFFLPGLDGGGRKFFHCWIKLNEEDY